MHAVAKILGPEAEFTQARDGLYQKYGWTLSAEEEGKTYEEAAEKWWTEQMKLYVRFGIEKSLLLEASRRLPPRKACVELLGKCLEHRIPVWIVSAGIANVIEYWLADRNLRSEEFHILANRLFYHGKKPSGYSEIVTIWNKSEAFFREAGADLEQKLIFLGNHPKDVGWRTENSESFLLGVKD